MRLGVVILTLLLMHGTVAWSATTELPQHFGKLTLGAPLSSSLRSEMEPQNANSHGIFSPREPFARVLCRAISQALDCENISALIYTHHDAVVGVDFSFYGKRYPDLVKSLSSVYGKPKIKNILDPDPTGVHLRKWIWRDENSTLYVIAVPESPAQLKTNDRSGIPHVVIRHNKLYEPYRKALDNQYREQ